MSSAFKLVGTLAAVVLVGLLIGWWATRDTSSLPASPQPGVTAMNPDPAQSRPVTEPVPAAQPGVPPAESRPAAVAIGNPAGNSSMTNWEDQIDEILGAEGEESAKANQMLQLFPQLPEDGQVEVAQHLSNLLADQDYAPLGNYLTNAALAEPVLDVLIADLLNRPNATKLPLLLDVARTENHPKSAEAKDILELFLEADYGKDWAKWQGSMQQWLQENPD